jgi:metal-responsive CopG/Arc/MetJ family transcriptional regulator
MEHERKMISVRLSATLVDRLDFVGRNIDDAKIKGRSTAVVAAIESWLPVQEDRLRELGVITKKAGRQA